MNEQDLTNDLLDTLDDLASLAIISSTSEQQHALRIHAGRIIALLQEQLDSLDYAHTLLVCEISDVIAEHYRQMYIASRHCAVEVSV
jgi:hypothetical protein